MHEDYSLGRGLLGSTQRSVLVAGHYHSGGACCLHLQAEYSSETLIYT